MVAPSKVLDRVLVLEMVRVTEAAAISASKMIGRGDEKAADAAAVGQCHFGAGRTDQGDDQVLVIRGLDSA